MSVPSDPDIYTGLSFVEYHAIDAVNHSTLEPFKRSAAHAREEMLHPPDQTKDMALGHAFHVALLEPGRFLQEYVVPPKVDRRTSIGKATWKEWETANPGKLCISQEEAELYEAMRVAALSHPTAGELLSGQGANELTIVWKDEGTGLLRKARIDRIALNYGGWSWIVDVKTCNDARERAFQKDIHTYCYHQQMAGYREGLNVLRPAQRRCAFICVEKVAPYAVAVWELDERALEQGLRETRRNLELYAECMKAGNWPSYDAGMGLLDLPAWATDKLE